MRDDPLRKSRRGRRVAVAEHEAPEVEAPPNDPTTGLSPSQVGWRGRRRRYGLGSRSTSPASSRPPGRTEVARRCETRLLAATADTLEPRHYAQTRMNRPPPHVHGKEDVCHRLPPVADIPLSVRRGSTRGRCSGASTAAGASWSLLQRLSRTCYRARARVYLPRKYELPVGLLSRISSVRSCSSVQLQLARPLPRHDRAIATPVLVTSGA
jgi:hypothetical protein